MKFQLLILYIQMYFSFSFDVSWIPSDPDGPLPLSSNFRSSLRKLCNLIDQGKVPPDLEGDKLLVVRKMCVKLKEQSDEVNDSILSDFNFLNKNVIGVIISTFVLYQLYASRRSIARSLNLIPSSQYTGDSAAAREARLKRFQ